MVDELPLCRQCVNVGEHGHEPTVDLPEISRSKDLYARSRSPALRFHPVGIVMKRVPCSVETDACQVALADGIQSLIVVHQHAGRVDVLLLAGQSPLQNT